MTGIIVALLVVFMASFIMSYKVIPKIAQIAHRKKLFDYTDERKVHDTPIPRLGGFAFLPSIVVPLFVVVFLCNKYLGQICVGDQSQLLMYVAAMLILMLVGMMDDLIGVRYKYKFCVQLFCALLVVISGLYFDSFQGVLWIYSLPLWIAYPFTVLTIMFIINAINLIDGIDGLASGLSMIAFVAFGVMFCMLGWWLYAMVSFAALGVLMPFFRFNVFSKANSEHKIFMGDTGSLLMGLLLSILVLKLSMSEPVKDVQFRGSIVLAMSFVLVPVLDAFRVFFRRLRNGKNPFMPDKTHIHHKFLSLGLTMRKALLMILLISAIFAVLNIVLKNFIHPTILLVVDIALWVVMHIVLSRKIEKRRSAKLDAETNE